QIQIKRVVRRVTINKGSSSAGVNREKDISVDDRLRLPVTSDG
ncbi:3349_t:CDS:1, partial [Paraglomus occultum]